MTEPGKSPRWGLVLSGGIAYGIANVGVVDVLRREGLRPDCIAGSSMGAIVGALYAADCPAAEIDRLCNTLRITDVARLSRHWWRGGVLRQRLEPLLAPLLGEKRIGDCAIPFLCIAGRVRGRIRWGGILRRGFSAHYQSCVEPYVFPPDTRLIDALLASTAMPLLFQPPRIGKDTFIDLLNFTTIPARELRAAMHPDIVIGTDTNPPREAILKFLPPGWREMLTDGYNALHRSREACDLLITPKLSGNSFHFGLAPKFRAAGDSATEKALPAIRKLLKIS